MTRYTARVRRGFAALLRQGLDRHVEELIRNASAPHLGRDKRIKGSEVLDLRTCIEWISQEARTTEPQEEGVTQ